MQESGISIDSMNNSLPSHISSVSAVHDVITFVNGCSTSYGNADERFISLAQSRKGKFFDASGMFH